MESTKYSTKIKKHSSVYHYLEGKFIFLKTNTPLFHFLDLDGTMLNMIQGVSKTKMCVQLCFQFLL